MDVMLLSRILNEGGTASTEAARRICNKAAAETNALIAACDKALHGSLKRRAALTPGVVLK